MIWFFAHDQSCGAMLEFFPSAIAKVGRCDPTLDVVFQASAMAAITIFIRGIRAGSFAPSVLADWLETN